MELVTQHKANACEATQLPTDAPDFQDNWPHIVNPGDSEMLSIPPSYLPAF